MPFITAENAKSLSAIGNQAKRDKQALKLTYLGNNAFSLPDRFICRRIARVRRQIEMISDMLENMGEFAEPLDQAQATDRYVSAITRLSELERQLSGRPLPGSLKPERQARPTRQHWPEPTPLPKPTISSVQPEAPKTEQAK